MRNVTTYTTFMKNDPVVIEIDDVKTLDKVCQQYGVRKPSSIRSKNIVVMDYFNKGDTLDILFGFISKDLFGMKVLLRPFYFMNTSLLHPKKDVK